MTDSGKLATIGFSALAAIGVALPVIAHFEGSYSTAYLDPIGIPTACVGHTGPDVKMGRTYSKAQCDKWLLEDTQEASAIVDRCIHAPMTINQRAALISFAFNEGAGSVGVKDGLCILKNGSIPKVRRLANAGKWAEACAGLMEWTGAGGKKLAGLVRRRASERDLCLRPDQAT